MMMASAATTTSSKYHPIASNGHFILMLLIQAAVVALGFWLQSRSQGTGSILPGRSNVFLFYLPTLALEWGLVATVRGAVNDKGFSLSEITGGRWRNWKDVVLDVAICVPFVLIWELTARLMHRLLGRDQATSVAGLLPQSALEVVLWIVVSISAGICEEIVFVDIFSKAVCRLHTKPDCRCAVAGRCFWPGPFLSGPEAGHDHCCSRHALWCAGCMAAQPAGQYDCSCMD